MNYVTKMTRKCFILLGAIFFSVVMATGNSTPAKATVTVTPTTAADQPFADALEDEFTTTGFDNLFIKNFLEPEANNLSRTNVIGSLMGHPGSQPFTKVAHIGATGGVAIGITDSAEIPIGSTIMKFPMAAAVAGFNIYGGLNPGILIPMLSDIDFTIVQGGGSFGMEFGEYELSGSSYRGGLLIRYSVIDPTSLVLVKFLGFSIGAGYSYQNVDYKLSRTNTDTFEIAGTPVSWKSAQSITFDASNSVIPLQAQTGFQLLFILNLHAGIGYTLAFGETSVTYSNEGPVSSDTAAASANLSMKYTGKSDAENTSYVFGGAEFNIFIAHLGVEVIYNLDSDNKVYGLTAYLKGQW